MSQNTMRDIYCIFCYNKSGISLSSNKLDKFTSFFLYLTFMSTIMDNIYTLKILIGKRAYSDPTQLVELITRRYCTANKARFRVSRVIDISRCE